MKTQIKKISSSRGQLNPQDGANSLVLLKKKKYEQQQVAKIKLQIEKQLDLIMKKDSNLLKEYLKKKEDLIKQKQKQGKYIQNLQYKTRLEQKKRLKSQERKQQTQKLRNKLQQGLQQAYEKNDKTKKKMASNTKIEIQEWKAEKSLWQQKILQLNKSRFQLTQIRRISRRQSNHNFFEEKNSRIVKSSVGQIQSMRKVEQKDRQQIQKIERDLVKIRSRSQSRIKQIQKIQSEIANIKQETLTLSRTLSSKKNRQNQSSQDERNSIRQKKNQEKDYLKGERKLSLPLIKNKKSLK